MNTVAAPPQSKPRTIRAGKQSAEEAIGTLRTGARLVGVTKGQFSLLDMIEAIVDQIQPADVLVSTWTPGKAEMERVLYLLERGGIGDFRLLVDRSFPGRHPNYVERVTEICGPESIRMTRTHAKFALIRSGDWRICIRTSMNFNTNPRLEQFDLDDSPEIYALFEGVANEYFAGVPAGLSATPADVHRGFNRSLRH